MVAWRHLGAVAPWAAGVLCPLREARGTGLGRANSRGVAGRASLSMSHNWWVSSSASVVVASVVVDILVAAALVPFPKISERKRKRIANTTQHKNTTQSLT